MASPSHPRSSPGCCGCGVLGLKSGERRRVNSTVIQVWKACLEETGYGMNYSGFSEKNLMMCRKCFAAYVRLHGLKNSVMESLTNAMSVLVQDDIATLPVSRQQRDTASVMPQASTSASPDVAVSWLYAC